MVFSVGKLRLPSGLAVSCQVLKSPIGVYCHISTILLSLVGVRRLLKASRLVSAPRVMLSAVTVRCLLLAPVVFFNFSLSLFGVRCLHECRSPAVPCRCPLSPPDSGVPLAA